jgi:16S rRNA (guanine527-N7)-methyltransferase
LAKGARTILSRPLAENEREYLCKYLKLLTKWNNVHRLVGSTDPTWMVDHLLLDSLLFLRILPARVNSLLDFGAGAGLPGIPLKIVRDEMHLTLLESRGRRVSFLSAAIRDLGLGNARVLNARAESVVEELAGSFDAVVMRCAGNPDELLPLASRFVSPGGLVVVSGPPRPRPLPLGDWETVPGLRPGETRWFAVYRRS